MNLELSFNITYIVLLTTGTVCFIEAIRADNHTVRHILNLETCISIVAAYFYSIFVSKIKLFEEKKIPIDWASLTELRYLDWAITTPLMILVLCATLGHNIKVGVHLAVIGLLIVLNYAMLGLGYMGEVNKIDKNTAFYSSFISFFAMFYLIYHYYIRPKFNFPNYVLYFTYLIVWTMYGVVYLLDYETKNIALNALDLISKGIVGLGIWAYFTRIIVH